MLKIRLSKTGRKNAHTYRIIVKETRSKRDGTYIDLLGYYNPLGSKDVLKIDEAKLKDWLSKGAQMTEGVAKILPITKPKTKETKKVDDKEEAKPTKTSKSKTK